MAKINSKIDQALRKEVIENGVLLGTVLIFGFNDNIYLYENEVYVEQFKLTDDDYVVTDFYRGSWEVINTNIYNGKFDANEPYAEALIDYMNLYNRSLYLSNKKYREIAKEQFAELKKEYEESGLLDDINALLKKSKSKTFRYSKYENKKNVEKSIEESVDKTFFDFMCDKDFFKGISKQVTKKEKCQFDFYKTPNSYTWLITYKEGESLSINMDERTNDIFIHVTKNGKSGKDFKFPQLKLDDSIDELLEIIFYYIQGNFDSSWYESKKSARKSLKEDSLDDIIPMGHSEYFDRLVEFFKHNDVPIKVSHTASCGKICYIENDMDNIIVIFKSPKRGYELLKMLEMYGDGSTYLSRGKGGAWHSNHVPLEEVYVWDMDKDEFVNYKGKVLKNIDYDDIVESKKNVEKSFKESTDIFDTLENAWDRSTKNNNVFEKTVLKLKTDSFKDPFNKYSIIYMFADGSSIDCNSLDPFDCDWCTYVSEDLSFVHEFKK